MAEKKDRAPKAESQAGSRAWGPRWTARVRRPGLSVMSVTPPPPRSPPASAARSPRPRTAARPRPCRRWRPPCPGSRDCSRPALTGLPALGWRTTVTTPGTRRARSAPSTRARIPADRAVRYRDAAARDWVGVRSAGTPACSLATSRCRWMPVDSRISRGISAPAIRPLISTTYGPPSVTLTSTCAAPKSCPTDRRARTASSSHASRTCDDSSDGNTSPSSAKYGCGPSALSVRPITTCVSPSYTISALSS